MEIKELIAQMTLEEKVSFLTGKNFSESTDSIKYGIPSMYMCDGPHGVRRQKTSDHLGMHESLKATCYPTAATMANSWDPELEYRMGAALGAEAVQQKLHVLLGPGLNIKRNPLCGRNREHFVQSRDLFDHPGRDAHEHAVE